MKLPLVHFFETSFGRIDDKHFILVRARRRRRDRLRRVRRGAGSVLQLRDQRDRLAHHHGVHRAARARRRVRAPARSVPGAEGDPRPQHGEGGRRDGGVGSVREAARRAARAACSAARASASPRASRSASSRRSTQLAAKVERELAAGYQRIKIKIKPGWDLAPVEMMRARFGAIPLMVDANAAYTLADADHLAAARSLRPDDDRAAARLRRHRRSRGAAAAAEDADLPRRVDQDRRHRARGDRRRRLPHHQHQAGPRRRLRRIDPAARSVRVAAASRCGTAACSSRASAAPPTCTCRRCRTSRCPATSPPASATSIPI